MSEFPYQAPETGDPRACPDCGAPLRLADNVCWLCLRRAKSKPRQGGILTALGVAMGLMLIVPASLVACIVVCTAMPSSSLGPIPEPTTGSLVCSGMAGALVFGVFLAAIIGLYKRI